METLNKSGFVEVSISFGDTCQQCGKRELPRFFSMYDRGITKEILQNVPENALHRFNAIRHSSYTGSDGEPACDRVQRFWICEGCGILYVIVSRGIDLY